MSMQIRNISEQFEIQQILGHGVTATVRKAISKANGQQYAIKVYETDRLKAKNQIDLLIRLDHPNIVNIFDVYEEENTIILVLEYLSGGQLYNMIGNKRKFSEGCVREYMKAIIDAVRYCHQVGIVHRDIKPENLLLSTNGPDAMLKLSDFGISRILSQQMLNTSCGTPIYMAPEIWQGNPYNEKVDIWSIGVVMYYLLAGTHPFDGDNQNLGAKIKQQELIFPEEMVRSISSKSLNLLRSLLNKDPMKRPSAKEIANHIWLNHIDSIPKDPKLVEEISLIKTVHRIRRFIVKEKLKKNNKMLHNLIHNTKNIGRKRLQFLLAQNNSQYSFTTTKMDETQGEKQQNQELQSGIQQQINGVLMEM